MSEEKSIPSGMTVLMTEHSMYEGTGTTKKYVEKAVESGIDRLVLADRNSIQDFVTFYKQCKANNIKPAVGVRLQLASHFDFGNYFAKNRALIPAIKNVFKKIGEKHGEDRFSDVVSFIASNNISNIKDFDAFIQSIFTFKKRIEKKSSSQATIQKDYRSSVTAFKRLVQSLSGFDLSKDLDNFEADVDKSLNGSMIYDFVDLLGDKEFEYVPYSRSMHSDILLIAENDKGFQNIRELISTAFIKGQDFVPKGKKRDKADHPYITLEQIAAKSEGLTLHLGYKEDPLSRALMSGQNANRVFNEFAEIYGKENIYINISKNMDYELESYFEEEYRLNSLLLDFAIENEVAPIAVNDARFVNQEDYTIHDLKRSIILQDTNNSIMRKPVEFSGQYMLKPEEMQSRFDEAHELLVNGHNFFNRVNINPELGISVLPEFPVPKGMDEASYLRDISFKGAFERLDKTYPTLFKSKLSSGQVTEADYDSYYEELKKQYTERLEFELDVIVNMGFPGYFLIVQDFINWAKETGVPVGPGRGSGAGSLVAYGLGIVDVDPMEYDLLFERFLNPERVSMPDFDIDFGDGFDADGNPVGRDDVIAYVARTYNNKKAEFPAVAQITTSSTMKAKSVIKDTGKADGFSIKSYENIAKIIPEEPDATLSSAFEESVEFQERYENEARFRDLIDACKRLEHLKKASGAHAGGVVIAKGLLTDFSAIEYETESEKYVTQYDKNSVEEAGLVKFDFLGLNNLSTISLALKFINANKDDSEKLDLLVIDKEDQKTFELLKRGETHSVFQLESGGMKDLVKRLEVENFEELAALLALFRPGPLQSGMVDDFVSRKHGRTEIEYPHPLLEDVLKNTYGVILYQEQVMQIAQVMANYTLGQADMLRRAMGKKKPEEMQKQREIFEKGASENGIDAETATYVFDLMEKFAGYGFNKSHSVAYAVVSYQTAYLKAHYPTEFMAAVLSTKMKDVEKIENVAKECFAMNLEILPPDINNADFGFTPKFGGVDNHIMYGLDAIKGTGSSTKVILEERDENGDFKSLKDFMLRLGKKHAKKNVVHALIYAGAMDNLPLGNDLLNDDKLFNKIYDRLLENLPKAELTPDEEQYFENNRDIGNIKRLMQKVGSNVKRSILLAQYNAYVDAMPTATEMKKIIAKKGHPDFKKDPVIDYMHALEDGYIKEKAKLAEEKAHTGIYLSGHPLDIDNLRSRLMAGGPLHQLDELNPEMDGANVRIAGSIVGVREATIKKEGANFGRKLCTVTIEDGHGEMGITFFPDEYDLCKDYLQIGNVVAIKGTVKEDDFANEGVKVACEQMMSLIPWVVIKGFKNNGNQKNRRRGPRQ